MSLQIAVDQEKIKAFCRRHQIQKLAFFGSVLGNDFREDSDIDVLVEYAPAHIPDLFDVVDQEAELSAILERKQIYGRRRASAVSFATK